MTYPRPVAQQAGFIADLRTEAQRVANEDKPVMEPLYVDLLADADAGPSPIHLGIRGGVSHLRDYLSSRQSIGVNHVALNLRFNTMDSKSTLQRLADDLLPVFSY